MQVQVRQLANRLQNATASERMDALQDLQGLARTAPDVVGEFALNSVLDMLKEQGSVEEYQDALDLIHRLVKNRDKVAVKSNSLIVLGDNSKVQILLDLLEHEDATIGVMASQILTEVHSADRQLAEERIQECNDGMNKLLGRLLDNSREEVRNQAIVLIQQLTNNNEEFKTTVAFNEGFETLFKIIGNEGGANDASVVTRDCLHIINNILHGNNTCQRFFYDMGGTEAVLGLQQFFDPQLLENLQQHNAMNNDDDDTNGNSGHWFDSPTRYNCALLALTALNNSLFPTNEKHQKLIALRTTSVLPSVAFWIGRRGPTDVVQSSLSLLLRIITKSPDIALKLSTMKFDITPSHPGRNIPQDVTEIPTLLFGWKPLPSDERRCITVLSLLVERYIYHHNVATWRPSNMTVSLKDHNSLVDYVIDDNNTTNDSFARGCLLLFERILATNNSISDLTIQNILAPHFDMDMNNDHRQQHLESEKSLGYLIINIILEYCNKMLNNTQYNATMNIKDIEIMERASNIFALFFIHGTTLTKELMTAITTNHIDQHNNSGVRGGGNNSIANRNEIKILLPLLLSYAGRAARIPGGGGYVILVAILRLLSTIASDCERASKLMLEDPSNLFVLDLATVASESAGVPPVVQVIACLFLGSCFQSLTDETTTDGDNNNATNNKKLSTVPVNDNPMLNKRSFLCMIDSRIGLNRFTELLKRPLAPQSRNTTSSTSSSSSVLSFAHFFVSEGFKLFYENSVEGIRAGIFEFYAGIGGMNPDSAQQQLITMQQDRIKELEEKIKRISNSDNSNGDSNNDNNNANNSSAILSIEQSDEYIQLQQQLKQQQDENTMRKDTEIFLKQENAKLFEQMNKFQSDYNSLQSTYQQALDDLKATDSLYVDLETKYNALLSTTTATSQQLQQQQQQQQQQQYSKQAEEEILRLKENILQDHEEIKELREKLQQKERLVDLLQSNNSASNNSNNTNTATTEKVTQLQSQIEELQNRNAELTQIKWESESTITSLKKELSDVTLKLQTAATTVSSNTASTLSETIQRVRSTSSSDLLEGIKTIADAVTGFIESIDLHLTNEDIESLKIELNNPKLTMSELSRLIEYIMTQCSQEITDTINTCSDIADAALISSHNIQLDGNEGSITRMRDICEKLSMQLQAITLKANESDRFRTQLEEVEGELENIRIELDNARGELDSKSDLEAILHELRNDYDDITIQHDKLKQQLQDKDELIQVLRDKTNNSNSSNSASDNDKSNQEEILLLKQSHSQQILQLEQQILTLQQDLESMKASHQLQLQEHSTKEHQLQHDLSAIKIERDKYKSLHTHDQDTIVTLQSDHTAMESQYLLKIQQLSTLLSNNEEELRQVKEENVNKSLILDDVSEKLTNKDKQVENAVQVEKARLTTLEHTIESYKKEIGSLKEDNKHKRHELQEFQQQLLTKEHQIKDLEEAKRHIEFEYNLFKQEHTSTVHNQHHKEEGYVKEISTLKTEIHRITNTLTHTQNQLKSLQGEYHHYEEESKNEIIQYKDKIIELDDIIQSLRNEIDEKTKEIQQYQEYNQQQQGSVNDKLHQVTQERDQMQNQWNTIKKEHELTLVSLTELKQTLESTQISHANELNTLRKQHQQEIITLQTQYEQEKRNIKDIADKSLLEKIEQAMQTNHTQQKQLESMKQELYEAKHQQEVLNSQKELLNQEIAKKTSTELVHINEIQQIKTQLTKLQREYNKYKQEIDEEKKQRQLAYESANNNTMDPFQAQQKEIKRLADLAEKLTKDLNHRDAELQSANSRLKRHEGEKAGLTSTMNGLKSDLETMRKDYEILSKQSLQDNKLIKELERKIVSLENNTIMDHSEIESLKNQLQSDKVKLNKHTSGYDDIIQEFSSKLNKTIQSLVTTYHIKEYNVNSSNSNGFDLRSSSQDSNSGNNNSSSSNIHNIQEILNEKWNLLDKCIQKAILSVKTQFDTQITLVQEREKEITRLKAIVSAQLNGKENNSNNIDSNSNDINFIKTPKKQNTVTSNNNNNNSNNTSNELFTTPVLSKGSNNNNNELIIRGSTVTKQQGSGSKSGLTLFSPGLKEAARLNSDLLRERRKLSQLQEQHSDLLGLLAQQEIELNTFKQAIQQRLGNHIYDSIEQQAEQDVIKQYGSYTNYRQYSNDDDYNNNNDDEEVDE